MNSPALTHGRDPLARHNLKPTLPLLLLLVGAAIGLLGSGTTMALTATCVTVAAPVLWLLLVLHSQLKPGERLRVRRARRTALERGPLRVGGYFASAQRLYRVEHVSGRRALVEDCRDGELIDMDVDVLGCLNPIEPG